jgi:hypothetical protein
MGYMTELNTLIGLPKYFDTSTLKVGQTYSVTKDRERSFPLHIAMLIVTPDWSFLGYAQAMSTENKDQKCAITFQVISLFTPEEQKIYKDKFLEAAKVTGEVK